MIKARTVVASFVAVAAASCARPPEPDFSADRIRAHVAFLADDLLRDARRELAGMTSPRVTSPASLRRLA